MSRNSLESGTNLIRNRSSQPKTILPQNLLDKRECSSKIEPKIFFLSLVMDTPPSSDNGYERPMSEQNHD